MLGHGVIGIFLSGNDRLITFQEEALAPKPPSRFMGYRPKSRSIDPEKISASTVGTFDPPRLCKYCKTEKKESDFHKDSKSIDGISFKCKECVKDYVKLRVKPAFQMRKYRKYSNEDMILSKQPEKIQKIVAYLTENPKISCEELGQKVDLEATTVRNYMLSNPFLRSLREVGLIKVNHLIPKALQALEESLESPAGMVKLNASVKVLEDQKVLGPQKIDVTVSSYENKSYEELLNIVKSYTPPPPPTLDAQVIS